TLSRPGDDLGSRRMAVGDGERGGRDPVDGASFELDPEGAGRPQVLLVGEPACGLLAGAHAAIPRAPGLPTGARHPVRVLEDEAALVGFDIGRAVRTALAVHVAPGAERG